MASLPILGQTALEAHLPGPVERALGDLWPVARSRLFTWGRLTTSLHLHRRYNLRPLRIGELKLMIPTGQVPDCEQCVDVCCTGPNAIVSLRLRDIAALMDAGLERFIARRDEQGTAAGPGTGKTMAKDAARATAKAPSQDTSWARREADGSVFARAFPVLARDVTGTCMLLTEERRCGAWPAWPLSCARYPYALDLQSKVIFWARGCGPRTTLPASEAPPKVRALVRAVVDGYNERVKDIVMLHLVRAELAALGLTKHLELDALH